MPAINAPVDYRDPWVAPIEPRQHTAWLIITPMDRRIAIWSKDATIEDVHDFCMVRWDEFWIGQLGVGEHIISQIDQLYMDDARFVDRDWNVSINVDLFVGTYGFDVLD